jgi:acyl-CoA thioester hydrolase
MSSLSTSSPISRPSPTSFQISLRVQLADLDHQGHVNNVVYLQWVQDVAMVHWQSIASPEMMAEVIWVVRRHEIEYKRAGRVGDEIVVHTRFGDSWGLQFERLTEIRLLDGTILATARTLWCPTNPQTGRPQRISPQMRALFSGSVLE